MLILAYPRFHHDHGRTFNVLFSTIITTIVGFLIWFRIQNDDLVFFVSTVFDKTKYNQKGSLVSTIITVSLYRPCVHSAAVPIDVLSWRKTVALLSVIIMIL